MENIYELTIIETRTYHVQASGKTLFDAEQDGVERFHRLTKSGDIVATSVSKPKVTRIIKER